MSPSSFKGANAYRNVGLQTQAPQQDPYQLVVMMFETTIECLNRARGAMVAGNVQTKVDNISKAVRIIQEGLRTSLDLDHGGELAANLANLYDYCVMRLTQANAANNADMLEEVVNLLKPVADAWKQMRSGAATGVEASATATEAAAAPAAPPKTPPVARRMGSAYGQGMAWAGA